MLLRPFHLALTALCCAASSAWALTTVDIAYLEETRPPVATLANLEPPPADLGRAGVELGIRDNDSTGKFLQQRFQLHSIQLPVGAPASEWLARLNKTKARLVVAGDGRLLGATFVGPEIAELVHAATVAVVGRMTLDQLWHAVPSFPTASEVWLRLLEASLD